MSDNGTSTLDTLDEATGGELLVPPRVDGVVATRDAEGTGE